MINRNSAAVCDIWTSSILCLFSCTIAGDINGVIKFECKNGVMDLGFRPGLSTAILSTAVSSTNKYLDFKVRLASIHYFLVPSQ